MSPVSESSQDLAEAWADLDKRGKAWTDPAGQAGRKLSGDLWQRVLDVVG
jgi:hypothetical protein